MNHLYRRIEALSQSKRDLLVRRLKRQTALVNSTDGNSAKRLVGYVVPGGVQTPGIRDLRVFLKETLPDYMIPSRFVLLDSLPLMPNGKIDYKSLPDPEQTRTASADDSFVEPTNEIERKLTEVWTEVLGIDVVGIHDNFFEVGGDSILSIQIIARAKRAGIRITPKQVFQYLTIAELARVAENDTSLPADRGPVTGKFPLTPIQHWFFERRLPNPHYWNQAYLLHVPRDLDLRNLEQALEHLSWHHEALRLKFHQVNAAWQQEITATANVASVQYHDISHLDGRAQIAALESIAAALQANFDITSGKVLAAALVERGADSTNRLCVAIHHLAVDAVSWRILLEDLETAYTQLQRGEAARLPAKTTSYKTWAERLVEYAKSDVLEQEQEYWLRQVAGRDLCIPVDRPGGANTEASERRVVTELGPEHTSALLQEAPAAYNTRIDDLLLTAMAMTFAHWTGSRVFSLDMEGHGREDIVDGVDLSRTVGWFTSLFPVTLEVKTTEPGDAIKAVKEQLRRVPRRGIGFGILRYLSEDKALRDALRQAPPAPVLYNYLGQFGRTSLGDTLFKPTLESTGSCHDPKGPRSHVLELDAIVIDDRLRLDWAYSEDLHDRGTIERLANDYMDILRRLIVHCQSPNAGGFSPSDFPEAELDQNALDELLQQLGGRQGRVSG